MSQRPANRLWLLTRIAVWIACYWLMTTLYWLSLDASGYTHQQPLYWAMARWLAAGHIVLLFIAYYWTTRMIYPTIVRERWWDAALQMAGLYLLIWTATYFLYTVMGESFMTDNERVSGYDGYFAQAGPFYSMTSLSIFLPNWWLYSILLTAVALRVSREIFHVQNRALRLEMNLLRAQINPHFIFNTLNNIYSIVEEKDPYAADILLKFGDIMRYTLHETDTNFIGLQQEIDVLNEYIELEQIRHTASAPAHVTFDVLGTIHDSVVPPLLLITVVENAFKHGTHATIGASWVRIRLEADNQRLRFEVSNSKPPNPPARPAGHKLNGHRVGLANIRRRLDLLYPSNHTLTISDTPDTYTVTLTLLKHGRPSFLLGR